MPSASITGCVSMLGSFVSALLFWTSSAALQVRDLRGFAPLLTSCVFFRFGYPADVCVFALIVGLEDPAPTFEKVDAFARWEATLNGRFFSHTFSVLEKCQCRFRSLYVVLPVAGEALLETLFAHESCSIRF